MKWKAKTSTVQYYEPKLGDRRERRRFAIFPVKIHGEWIWWEKYLVIQERKEIMVRQERVVDSGIIFEKYAVVYEPEEWWIKIGRRLPNGEPYIFEEYK